MFIKKLLFVAAILLLTGSCFAQEEPVNYPVSVYAHFINPATGQPTEPHVTVLEAATTTMFDTVPPLVFVPTEPSVTVNYPGSFTLVTDPYTFQGWEVCYSDDGSIEAEQWDLGGSPGSVGVTIHNAFATTVHLYYSGGSYQSSVSPSSLTDNTYAIGDQIDFTWTLQQGCDQSTTMSVFLSRDGGSTYDPLTVEPYNSTGYTWTATEPASSDCRIRLEMSDYCGNTHTRDLGPFSIAEPGIDAPILASPSEGATIEGPTQVTLDWDPVTNADEYWVQLARDEAFSDIVENVPGLSSSTTDWATPELYAGTYYWHVQASGGGHISDWSEKRGFLIYELADTDGDGIYDDGDRSGVTGDNPCIGGSYVNCDDNCIDKPNEYQEDIDDDGIGDVCDDDRDGDGILDDGDFSGIIGDYPCHGGLTANCDDNCLEKPNANQTDIDDDGQGDICDEDRDGDGILDDGDLSGVIGDHPCHGGAIANCDDNCLNEPNADQSDIDDDWLGDVCDSDRDDDGILDDGDFSGIIGDNPCAGGNSVNCDDNCLEDPNADQEDRDGDGIGFACDDDVSGVVATLAGPLPNAVDVGRTQSVYMLFNEAIDPVTVNNSTFKVIGRSSGEYPGVVTCAPGNTFVEFAPTGEYISGEEITVVLTSDIQTPAGLRLLNGSSWTCTVENCGDGNFDSGEEIPVGHFPTDVVLADLNNDGFLDAATCNTGADISVLLNDGTGTSLERVDWEEVTSLRPYNIHAADVDNDGYMDLIPMHPDGSTLTIYKNNGSGGFPYENVVTITLYHSDYGYFGGYSCFPADIDQDGNIDIVLPLINSAHDVIGILYGNGNGTFGSPIDIIDLPWNHNPTYVYATDLNNDANIDLVSANFGAASVSVFLNDGYGEFTSRDDYATDIEPYDIAVGDFTDNGYLDLAVVHWSGHLTILCDRQDGTFETNRVVNLPNVPTSIVAANLDYDDDVDLVLCDRQQVIVLWNNGDGIAGIPSVITACSPVGVVAGDLNNDGSNDIVVAGEVCNAITVIRSDTLDTPLLVSPEDSTTFVDMNTPTLDCSDVARAERYFFQIDDNPNFWSPISTPAAGVTVSQWTTPNLAVGTYYWRVRVLNRCAVPGAWSDVRQLGIEKAGVVPSCPVLFSYDGYDFQQENPLLTACEQSGYTDDVTDYYHLTSPVAPKDGQIVFQLREMEDEITYLDGLELITVDHTPNTSVGCAVDGQIFVYENSSAPLSAVDQDGVDWTEVLASANDVVFETDEPGFLTLTFPNTDSETGIRFGAPAKDPCPEDPGDGGPQKTVAGLQTPLSSLTVEQLSPNGAWVELPDVPSRVKATGEFVMSDPSITSTTDEIVIRVSWEDSFSADEIHQYVPSDETPTVSLWQVDSHQLTADNPAAKAWSGFDHSDALQLRKDEMIEFSFAVDDVEDTSTKRDYIVVATGKYQPDYSVYTNLIPNQIHLYDNYPNPFNPATTISYDLPAGSDVNLSVYNLLGQAVTTLVDKHQEAGHHTVEFNSTDGNGNPVASGIYFYRLTTNDYSVSKKMILLK